MDLLGIYNVYVEVINVFVYNNGICIEIAERWAHDIMESVFKLCNKSFNESMIIQKL